MSWFGRSKKITIPRRPNERDLIKMESVIGGQLFGPIAKGAKRQFFCLDRHAWVWHEEWIDQNGRHQNLTTRYEVRPTGILKAQGNQPYHYVAEEEAKHLIDAAKIYLKEVDRRIYNLPSQA